MLFKEAHGKNEKLAKMPLLSIALIRIKNSSLILNDSKILIHIKGGNRERPTYYPFYF